MPVDRNEFRNALGRFASGVTVVTTVDAERQPQGLTVSAFSSLSLEPPLVLVCIDRQSSTHGAFVASGVFAVNILSSEQELVSKHFATRTPDKFGQLTYRTGLDGVPLIEGALANLECRLVHSYAGGDHTIFVGQVEAATVTEADPLLHHRGAYGRLLPKG